MPTIASLNVAIKAETDEFLHGMDRSQKEVKSFADTATDKFNSINAAMISLGTVASERLVEGLHAALEKGVEKIVDAFKEIDEASKTAQGLGLSTAEFQGMAYAADMAGVKTEAFTTAMQHMTRSIGDLAIGKASAVDAFHAIGVNIDEIQKMQPAAAFNTIVDALSKIDTPAQRASAAFEIFGKSSAGLLPILAEGSSAFKSAAQDAEHLGITIADVNAKNIEDAVNSAKRLDQAFKGIADTIATQMARKISTITTLTTEMLAQIREGYVMWEAMHGGFGVDANGAPMGTDPNMNFVGGQSGAQGEATQGIMGAHIEALKAQAEATDDAADAAKSADEMQKALNKTMEEGEKVFNSVMNPEEKYLAGIAHLDDLLKIAAITQETYNRAVEKLDDEMAQGAHNNSFQEGYQKHFQEMAKEADKFKELLETPSQKFMENIDKSVELFKNGLLTATQLFQLFDKDSAAALKATDTRIDTGTFKQFDPSRISAVGLSKQSQKTITHDAETAKIIEQGHAAIVKAIQERNGNPAKVGR